MKHFAVSNLTEWHEVAPGEILTFAPSASGQRSVKLTVISNGRFEVWADEVEQGEEHIPRSVMVAMGDHERISVDVNIGCECEFRFVADEGVSIFARGIALSHQVAAEFAKEKFTTIAPTKRRNSDYDRMLTLMRHNEKARERQYNEQIKRLEVMQSKAIADHVADEQAAAKAKAKKPAQAPETQVEGETDE